MLAWYMGAFVVSLLLIDFAVHRARVSPATRTALIVTAGALSLMFVLTIVSTLVR